MDKSMVQKIEKMCTEISQLPEGLLLVDIRKLFYSIYSKSIKQINPGDVKQELEKVIKEVDG